MKRLDPRAVRWLVVHTAAHDGDASAAEIRRWHTLPHPKGNGWLDIGYHFVIRKNGDLETGRSLEYVGAHCAGINTQSIGVCCSGNGDKEPFTEAQVDRLIELAVHVHRTYKVEPRDMIGHREINDLVKSRLVTPKYLTTKSCPGKRVDMNLLRIRLANTLYPPPDPFVLNRAA